MIILDKTIKRASYLQISDALINMIEQNILTHGEKLPSLTELSEFFDVSLKVSNQVYAMLNQKGLMKSKRGQGYYVNRRKQLTLNLNDYNKFEDIILEKGMKRSILMINQMIPDHHVQMHLHLLPTEYCYKIQQVFTLDYMTYAIQYLYFPIYRYHDFKNLYSKTKSLKSFLRLYFEKKHVQQRNKFIAMQASNMYASILKLSKNAPLWRIETLIQLKQTKENIVYYETFFSGQDVNMKVELNVL
jgi:DNA-binding GntR family transcriptional regulator